VNLCHDALKLKVLAVASKNLISSLDCSRVGQHFELAAASVQHELSLLFRHRACVVVQLEVPAQHQIEPAFSSSFIVIGDVLTLSV